MNNAYRARRVSTADADPVAGPRPQAARRIELRPEAGPIDLRSQRSTAKNIQDQEAERRSRIRWSDQDNEPKPPRAKPTIVKSGGGSHLAPIGLLALALGLAGAAAYTYSPQAKSSGEVTVASASMTDVPVLDDTPTSTTAAAAPAPAATVPGAAAPAVEPAVTSAAKGQPAPPPTPVKTVKIAPPPIAPVELAASSEPIPTEKSSRLPTEADPRWAVADSDAGSAQRIFEAPPSAGDSAAAIAAIKADDAEQPASAASNQVQPSASVADDAAASKASPAATDDTQTAAVAPEEANGSAARAEAAPESASATRTARISSGVNFRASRNGGRVLGVIPKGATVGIVSCGSWCEITYKGQRGFVYKSFVGGQSASASAAPRARSQRSVQGKSRAPSPILSTTREQPLGAKAQPAPDLPGVKTPAGTAP